MNAGVYMRFLTVLLIGPLIAAWLHLKHGRTERRDTRATEVGNSLAAWVQRAMR